MKILHLLYESKGDHFGIGGVGMRAYEIYRYLKDRHDVTLLCKKYPGAGDGEIDGVRHLFVGTESRSLTATLLSYAFHASRFVRRYGDDYDVIIEDFSPAIPTFLHAFTKRPIILQVQGYTGLHYFRKYNPFYVLFLYSLEKLRPLLYKNLIFISKETIKRVFGYSFFEQTSEAGYFMLRNRLIGVIPNGVSPELLSVVPQEGDYILYIGRIDIYGKGLDILLKAYQEFFKSFPKIRLVIVGDGRDRKRFETMLSELPSDVKKNIDLKGWTTGKDKTEILRKALFCVFPSRHEVQPIAALEAMACGKAMIVSDIHGFGHIIQNRAGISFRTGDALSLALSMKELITRDDRKEIGERGKDWVKDFTWDRMALRFEKFLTRTLQIWYRRSRDVTVSDINP